jgi:RNA-splicing ligase RtcB
MLFSRFEVRIDGQRLHGKAWGEKVHVSRHRPAVEVMGAKRTAVVNAADQAGLSKKVAKLEPVICVKG